MDISAAASSISNYKQSTLQLEVGNSMLRKSLDMQAQYAQQMLEALPAPPSGTAVASPSLGQHIDVRA
jgi:hypothetical protein